MISVINGADREIDLAQHIIRDFFGKLDCYIDAGSPVGPSGGRRRRRGRRSRQRH
jgi:hypothetical protein